MNINYCGGGGGGGEEEDKEDNLQTASNQWVDFNIHKNLRIFN